MSPPQHQEAKVSSVPLLGPFFIFQLQSTFTVMLAPGVRHSGQTLTCPRQGPPLTRCPPGTIRSHPGARRGSDCTGARPAGAGRRKRGACTVTSAAPTDGRKPENHCLRAEGLLTSQSFHFTDKKTDSGRRSRPAVCGLWQSRRQSCGVPCSGLSAPLLASQL